MLVETDPHDAALEIARQVKGHHHWGYSGDEGPEKWGDLDEHYAVCGGGPYQSPVALKSLGTPGHTDDLRLE